MICLFTICHLVSRGHFLDVIVVGEISHEFQANNSWLDAVKH